MCVNDNKVFNVKSSKKNNLRSNFRTGLEYSCLTFEKRLFYYTKNKTIRSFINLSLIQQTRPIVKYHSERIIIIQLHKNFVVSILQFSLYTGFNFPSFTYLSY